MEKKLLIIYPSKELKTHMYIQYVLVIPETGEILFTHMCSNSFFAYGDLYGHRLERKKELMHRFGEIEIKFIDETILNETELIDKMKNHPLQKENWII